MLYKNFRHIRQKAILVTPDHPAPQDVVFIESARTIGQFLCAADTLILAGETRIMACTDLLQSTFQRAAENALHETYAIENVRTEQRIYDDHLNVHIDKSSLTPQDHIVLSGNRVRLAYNVEGTGSYFYHIRSDAPERTQIMDTFKRITQIHLHDSAPPMRNFALICKNTYMGRLFCPLRRWPSFCRIISARRPRFMAAP